VLREAGLVRDRRDGRWIHYSLVADALREAEDGLASLRADAKSVRLGGPSPCAP
jgi:DNA-binding transcriptional ArsR family regulator